MTRQRCEVPFCKRTAPIEAGTEMLCGQHGRLVDPRLRRLFTAAKRQFARVDALAVADFDRTGGTVRGDLMDRWEKEKRRHDRLWAWVKRRAIERAGGIG